MEFAEREREKKRIILFYEIFQNKCFFNCASKPLIVTIKHDDESIRSGEFTTRYYAGLVRQEDKMKWRGNPEEEERAKKNAFGAGAGLIFI